MDFEILETSERLTRIRLCGRLDTPGVDRIEARLNAAMAKGGHGILDLNEVTFLSSLGVRLLLGLAKRLDRRSAKLVLVAPRPLVGQALKHSSLDELLPVTEDLDAALALLA